MHCQLTELDLTSTVTIHPLGLSDPKRMLPIVGWLPQYDRSKLIGDVIAGLTVGLMLIPQGMAYGSLAGLPPIYGLYSSFMGVFMYAIFGTAKDIAVGPTALMSLIVAEAFTEVSDRHSAYPHFTSRTATQRALRAARGFVADLLFVYLRHIVAPRIGCSLNTLPTALRTPAATSSRSIFAAATGTVSSSAYY